jgi:hypothetical protein
MGFIIDGDGDGDGRRRCQIDIGVAGDLGPGDDQQQQHRAGRSDGQERAGLCLNGDIYRAMPEVCHQYLPQPKPGYRAPPPVPARYAQAEASEEQPYTGGDIWLVEGATGKNRLCNDYDVTQQSCRVWAHTVHHSAPKKKSATAGGFSAMDRCAKTDDEPRLLQKTSMLCGKFFPPRGLGQPPYGQSLDAVAQLRLQK